MAAYCAEANLTAAANPFAVVSEQAVIVAVTSIAAVTEIGSGPAAHHQAIKKHFGSAAAQELWVVVSCVLSVDLPACLCSQIVFPSSAAVGVPQHDFDDLFAVDAC